LQRKHYNGRQESVLDSLPERVDGRRFAEIFVGIDVIAPFRCGGQADLHGGQEVFEKGAPVALVVRTSMVALVDDDEVEIVRRILSETGRALRACHEGMEDDEKDAAVGRHPSVPANLIRLDAGERIGLKGRKVVERPIGKVVPVGEKEYARPPPAVAVEVPTALEELRRSERR